ncbi:hypothetical protein SAMN05428961_104243 [Paenibacillus sp. OK060]|nr:hypothetical protein SAMN05428961_104243 [Paenibacillus sp. OK060]
MIRSNTESVEFRLIACASFVKALVSLKLQKGAVPVVISMINVHDGLLGHPFYIGKRFIPVSYEIGICTIRSHNLSSNSQSWLMINSPRLR